MAPRKKQGSLAMAAGAILFDWAYRAPQEQQNLVAGAINDLVDEGISVGPEVVRALIRVAEGNVASGPVEGPEGTQ